MAILKCCFVSKRSISHTFDFAPSMAKTGVVEADPRTAKVTELELKRELQRLVKAILSEDDINVDALDKTQQTLVALKDLKLKRPSSFDTAPFPDEFRCPLSKQLMRDPVILSTGQVTTFITAILMIFFVPCVQFMILF